MRKRPKLSEHGFDKWAENIRSWIAESVSPFEKDTPEKKRRRIARANKDKLFFMRTYLPHYFSCSFGEFHGEWADLGDMRNQVVLVAAPREHGKSTVFTFGDPLCDICCDKRKFIMIISDSRKQAIGFTLPILLELETNTRILHDFGDMKGRPWSRGDFVTSAGVRVLARGRGEKVRGLKNRQFRPDKALVDDLENDKNVQNPRLVEDGKRWLQGAVMGSMGDGFVFLMVGNLFHPKSILSLLMAEKDEEDKPRYISKIYRAEIDHGTPNARPLWPALWPMERLVEKRRLMGSVAYSAEMLNLTKAAGGAFREEWIQTYDRKKIMRRPLVTASFADPSAKSGEENDFRAIVTVGMDRSDMRLYVLHAFIRHVTLGRFFDAAYNQHDAYQGRMGIEENMFHEFLHYSIKKYAQQVGRYLPWEPTGHSSNKKSRIIGTLSWLVEQGLLLFDPGQSDQARLIEQLVYLENDNVHDDGPDALEGAVRMVQTETGSVPRVISAPRAAPMPQYGEVFDMEKYYL